jgi:hypothetical protein
MTNIRVQKKTDAALFRASIDGTRLKFDGNTAIKPLPDGEHVIQWFVEGSPEDEYTISITRPDNAAFTHTDKLDSSRRDAGHKWFKIGEEA